MHAIIGSGISGISYMLKARNPILFDKAKSPGGRNSTKKIGNSLYCDIGATYINNDPIEILSQNNSIAFSAGDFLESLGIKYSSIDLKNLGKFIYPVDGMTAIADVVLSSKKTQFSKELVSFSKYPNGEFLLRFLDGTQFDARNLTIATPIPQAINFLPHGEDKDLWEKFLSNYNHYRKTLVAVGSFHGCNYQALDQLSKLNQYSFLDKSRSDEYISLESFKFINNKNSLVFMIQYSAEFSNNNYDNWRNPDKSPTEFCKNQFIQDFKVFMKKNQISWHGKYEPSEWIAHKWKYAQALAPLLGNSGILNLDSQPFLEYEKIVEATNINITGDWLYGSRMERIVGGILNGRIIND